MKNWQNTALRVGITGGIGTGKTTVCRLFETLGVPVYDADYWAKWLITNDEKLKATIVQLFGKEAYSATGEYNRALVSQKVFSEPAKLAALNAAVHPAVEKHGFDWHEKQIKKGCPYTLKEAALMVESGSYKKMDFLIVVSAPEPIRLQRVMERDGLTEEQVRTRMTNQLPEVEKLALADAIILNDGEHSLVKQVWSIHQNLLKKLDN
jgi:dephospho-CoA kinase